LASLSGTVNGLTLQSIYLKLLNPFQFSKRTSSLADSERCNDDNAVDLMDATPSYPDESVPLEDNPERSHYNANGCEEAEGPTESYCGLTVASGKEEHMEQFEFYLSNERNDIEHTRIEVNDLKLIETTQSRLHVSVHWHHSVSRQYNTSVLNNIPEIHKLELIPKESEDCVALHGCLEAFLKEEPLGPEDMW
jgi:ubiquitin carboxyl-terminal hydrolase 4/11/15